MDSQERKYKVLILGCGRVGSTLARQLSNAGHDVTIIDLTSDSFRRLGPKFKGHRIVGTGLDQDTLIQAGIRTSDIFVAVTQGDNSNIMAAQIARDVFDVPRVIARIYDPIRSQAYRELGITTLCTTTLAAHMIRSFAVGDTDAEALKETVEQWDKEYLEMVG
jgi:trk system potassium uptake protein TrkA